MYDLIRKELDEISDTLNGNPRQAEIYQKILELARKSYDEGMKSAGRLINL